jgi:hypothetical protein
MIYTGNNGRIYVARAQEAGLTGSFTMNVLSGRSVTQNSSYYVRNITGDGRGAVVRADRSVSDTATTRTCVFTVISGGWNYAVGDVVRFSYSSGGNVIDVVGNQTIDATETRGVDSEREILDDQYRIAKIRSWSLTSNSEIVETTALGDVVKTYSPSVTSGEGSATLMFYEDEIMSGGTDRQKDIFELVDLLFPRSAPPRVILNLAVDGSSSGRTAEVGGNALWKTNFLFNAYITSASVGVSYGEVVTVDTSFTVDGALLDVPWKPNVARL